MNFYITENRNDPLPVPTELVQTDIDGEQFLKVFGDPQPGWQSATFAYKATEWVWRRMHKPSLVKAANIRGKIVLAISDAETYHEFLAFVDYRFKNASM